MKRLLVLWVVVAAQSVLADGMVVPEVFYPKVEIPNQQALIHFANGVERLVIETSFLGEGTNFAWVVPLPSAPQVQPVSEGFFNGLRQAFQPQLVHRVHPYYVGLLFFCGLAFLGWRSLRDEASWIADLPLCLVLGAGMGLLERNMVAGLVAAGLALATRLSSRTPASFALLLLIGTAFDAGLMFIPSPVELGLIETLGGSSSATETDGIPGVSVLSVQRAGVFDATTIRGSDPNAVLQWLEKNGYQPPTSAQPAIRYYHEHGWVFVASKVRCASAASMRTALHPLVFTFATGSPVYPTRLTAVDNGACTIDLFVFGNRRAKARHFGALRCDRVINKLQLSPNLAQSGLSLSDPELLALVGDSSVGTKLSGRPNPYAKIRIASPAHSQVAWATRLVACLADVFC